MHRTSTTITACGLLLVFTPLLPSHATAQQQPKASEMTRDKEALAPLQAVVGRWRGTGQLRRGSARGSWGEHATWRWSFDAGRAGLELRAMKGKYFRSAGLRRGKKAGDFELQARLARGPETATYSGRRERDGRLVLTMDPEAHEKILAAPARVTMRLLAKDRRLVVLYEGRRIESGRFFRLGEVGFTRKGESIAAGDGYPQCVVTGGKGTITVEHDGRTYSVCCSGCRDAFQDNPRSVLAEWRDRRQKTAETPARRSGDDGKKKSRTSDGKKKSRTSDGKDSRE